MARHTDAASSKPIRTTCCPHLFRTHVICRPRLSAHPSYPVRPSRTPFLCIPHPTPRRQAEQIFERHRLPRDGCSVHTLSTHLLNPLVDTAQLARAEGRRALGSPYASSTRFSFAQGPRTPRISKVAPAPAAPPSNGPCALLDRRLHARVPSLAGPVQDGQAARHCVSGRALTKHKRGLARTKRERGLTRQQTPGGCWGHAYDAHVGWVGSAIDAHLWADLVSLAARQRTTLHRY